MEPKVAPHPLYGFFQLAEKPTADDLAQFYESKYYDPLRKSAQGSDEARVIEAATKESAEDLHWRMETEHADIDHYLSTLAPGRKVVDIGAGIGQFVESLSSRGYDAMGIEPSREASLFAQKRGVNVVNSNLEAFCADETRRGAFDAVTLMNVLEHVPEPELTLRQLRGLLAPGGILMVRCPNDFSPIQAAAVAASGVRRWWIVSPDHISYFSRETLTKLLAAHGLKVEVATCDFPIDWFLLMGKNYVAQPELGGQCHAMRRSFELSLPGPERRNIYEALAAVGIGRNIILYARNVTDARDL